jgi:hypothetical protein
MRVFSGLASVAAVATIAAVAPGAAQAAQRFAAPSSKLTTGSCDASAPCDLVFAVQGASVGDEVVLAPGGYKVTTPLSPSVPIVLRGSADRPRPHIKADSKLGAPTLTFTAGGTLRHLAIRTSEPMQSALVLQGGLAEDLVLRSEGGDAVKVLGSPSPSVLRDAVALSGDATVGRAAVTLSDGSGGGDIALRNVTAYGAGTGAIGVRCETSAGRSGLVNVIARGTAADIDASGPGAACSADHSAFRPLLSPGLGLGTANLSVDPHFVDVADGDLRLAADSPLIDGGAFDPLLGTSDPDGRPRTLGFAPDIGAYEQGDFLFGEEARRVAPPKLGKSITVARVRGRVTVRTPRGRHFLLGRVASVPVGSIMDARRGDIAVRTALDAGGSTQTGGFRGGRFQVRQRPTAGGMTSIILRGGDFRRCRARPRGRAVVLASRSRRVRRLWSRDRGGRFRTHGRNSIATARGTAWLTVDRCDGTLTRVTEGAVAVRDRRARRTVLVRKSRSYLARSRR